MKKISIGLALLFSGLAEQSFASLPNNPNLAVCVPKFCGGFTLGIAGLYWEPSTSHLDYALTYPEPTVLGDDDSSVGRYHSNNPSFAWGFKANIGYVFPCSGNDVVLSWTQYDNNNKHNIDDVLLPAVSSTWPTIGSFTTPVIIGLFPGGDVVTILPATFLIPATGELQPVAATYKSDFDYNAVDLEFAQNVNFGNFSLRYFGGVRYADLDQKFDVTYQAFGTSSGGLASEPNAGAFLTLSLDFATTLTETVNQKSNFSGIGPRFGVDASYHFGQNFGLVGGIATSLLIGELDTKLFENLNEISTATVTSITSSGDLISSSVVVGSVLTSITDTSETFKQENDTHIVPNIDARFGLGYSYQFTNPASSKISVEAGWMVTHYFNSSQRLSGTAVHSPEFRTSQVIDTNFDGPYIGVQLIL